MTKKLITTKQTAPAKTCFDQGKQHLHDGNSAAAMLCFKEAIRLQADFVPAYNNLGNLLQAEGLTTQAIDVYQQALQLAPTMAVLHCNMAGLWQFQGDTDLAIASYQRALTLDPDFLPAHFNLGKVFASLNQFADAEKAYQAALKLKPDYADVHLELGHIYRQQGLLDMAISCFKTALRSQPDFARAYNSLGATLQQRGEMNFSQICYRRALVLQPDNDVAYANLGLLLEDLGQLDAAQQHYEQALALQPQATAVLYRLNHLRLKLADWQDYEQRLATLIAQTQVCVDQQQAATLPIMQLMSVPMPMALQSAVAKQVAESYALSVTGMQAQVPPVIPEQAPARLRLGYVSPDFRCHAVGMLIHEMFQYHQRPDFEIFAYSLIPTDDDWTESIRQGCDHFIDVAFLSPLAIAQRIQADGIHILIDLAGYTSHSLTALFALKPAPVQLHYLGYPGTLSADFIPYMLADHTLLPPSTAAHYTEQILHLPHAWVAAPMDIADVTLTRADYGLPADGMVFCCFNGTYKIDPSLFQVWMRILQQLPGSVLWLSEGGHPLIKQRLQQQAKLLGIAPERLIFAGQLPHDEYLARYRLADLFLDTFNYSAASTAIGALWAGLPVLTCPGESNATRMGASLSHAIGMPELICASSLAYEQQALELGRDRLKLAALKAKLADMLITAPLFKPQVFIQTLEHTLRTLWQTISTDSTTL
ncbi:glycosyltransferase family 41 protein [Methylobacter sp. S3L5C]|uniref:O-linked N-acetylglucosamine transferase, SPINDLY family protein n=1 Tax=Methylobacter sp. S3L5C TaxID=2839024 RepID=UPI001FADFDF3|nr:glycosyltransferase family 41 protein [Methylobacter sp. S3L5C]UOA08409.1 tetratricopeptide repeat protein [Methylobacter sp. S3L5C]